MSQIATTIEQGKRLCQAAQFAKGQLVEDIRNNPNRGSVKVERIK